MADPVFDKDGNLTNVDELTREEVASAYSAKNRQLFGRLTEAETATAQAKANEAKAKSDLEAATKKPETPPTPPVPPTTDQPTPEELYLIAGGLSKEEVEQAKKVAKVEGVSLTDALKTELFLAWQNAHKAKLAQDAAKLPGSRGSAQNVPVEGIKPGQTREEHLEVWKRTVGKK